MEDNHDQTVREAIVYVYRHLDQPLTINEVSRAIGTSESSLKRAFCDVMGDSPGAVIRRLKMESALQSLAGREQSVLEVALAAGFDDHSAFSRSFKKTFGFAPSGARKRLSIQRDLANVQLEEPDFVDLRDFDVEAVVCQGYYFECSPRAWATLAERLEVIGEHEREGALFVGLALDDPHRQSVRNDEVRFAAGIYGLPRSIGGERLTITGGRHARFRFEGQIANVGLAYHYIYGPWRESGAARMSERPAHLLLDASPRAPTPAKALHCVPIE